MALGSTKLHWHTGGGDWQRRKILQFVQEFVRREGYSPSYREIAEELGLAGGHGVLSCLSAEPGRAPPDLAHDHGLSTGLIR